MAQGLNGYLTNACKIADFQFHATNIHPMVTIESRGRMDSVRKGLGFCDNGPGLIEIYIFGLSP